MHQLEPLDCIKKEDSGEGKSGASGFVIRDDGACDVIHCVPFFLCSRLRKTYVYNIINGKRVKSVSAEAPMGREVPRASSSRGCL